MISRRKAIKLGLASTALGVVGATKITHSWGREMLMPTPAEVEGPFYPITDQHDKDADLTLIAGHKKHANGQPIIIEGTVTDINGMPVNHAVIELWQANASGKYNHPRDPNPAPLDPDFLGWAVINSDRNGFYSFKTVKPGAYPATKTWIRPPHIHFKISGNNCRILTTQLYFPDEPLNEADLLLRNKSLKEQSAMIAKFVGKYEDMIKFSYNIVLMPG